MARIKNQILGIAVISVGVCAALPFRNDTAEFPRSETNIQTKTADRDPRDQLQLNLSIPAPQLLPAHEQWQPSQPATLDLATVQQRTAEYDPADLLDPPDVASQFEAFVPPQAADLYEPPQPNEGIASDRAHKIEDGDTLESLAQRYFGDRGRWHEIHDANSELLQSWDLLPIGKELKIPSERARVTPSDETSDGQLPANLVPIPPRSS